MLAPGGFAKIQMAHKYGLRSIYWQTRPDYLKSGPFRVRYWTLKAIRELFERSVGETTITPEAFGGLGLLPEDREIVPQHVKRAIQISELAKKVTKIFPPLIYLADSVYVLSHRG